MTGLRSGRVRAVDDWHDEHGIESAGERRARGPFDGESQPGRVLAATIWGESDGSWIRRKASNPEINPELGPGRNRDSRARGQVGYPGTSTPGTGARRIGWLGRFGLRDRGHERSDRARRDRPMGLSGRLVSPRDGCSRLVPPRARAALNTATASHATAAEPAHRQWNERIIAMSRLDDPDGMTRNLLPYRKGGLKQTLESRFGFATQPILSKIT